MLELDFEESVVILTAKNLGAMLQGESGASAERQSYEQKQLETAGNVEEGGGVISLDAVGDKNRRENLGQEDPETFVYADLPKGSQNLPLSLQKMPGHLSCTDFIEKPNKY